MPNPKLQALQKKIDTLARQAEELKTKNLSAVIAKMKAAIDLYDLKPADLFGPTRAAAKTKVGATTGKPTTAKRAPAKQYADANGNTWMGRGPRPAWLREALDAGHQLEEFLKGARAGKMSSAKVASKASTKATKAKRASTRAKPEVPAAKTTKTRKLAGKLPGKRLPKGTKPVGDAPRYGAGVKQPVRFSDGENNWSGRGSKPRWLVAAIKAGRKQEDFAVGQA